MAKGDDSERLTDCPNCGHENKIPMESELPRVIVNQRTKSRKKSIPNVANETWSTVLAIGGGMLGGAVILVIFKSIVGAFKSSDNYYSSQPSEPSSQNIISVKESSSNPTFGIIRNPKGKPGYLYVPAIKSYEVTSEENGVLKTRTMNHDPTK